MAAQRQIPGGPYVNETTGKQYQIPGWQYINQTQGQAGAPIITGTVDYGYEEAIAWLAQEELEQTLDWFQGPVVAAAAVVVEYICTTAEPEEIAEEEQFDGWTPQLFDPWSTVDAIRFTFGEELDAEEATEDWVQFPTLNNFPLVAVDSGEIEEEEATEDRWAGYSNDPATTVDAIRATVDDDIAEEEETEAFVGLVYDAAQAAAADFITATVDEDAGEEEPTDDGSCLIITEQFAQPDWLPPTDSGEIDEEEATDNWIGLWQEFIDYISATVDEDAGEEEATDDWIGFWTEPVAAAADFIVTTPSDDADEEEATDDSNCLVFTEQYAQPDWLPPVDSGEIDEEESTEDGSCLFYDAPPAPTFEYIQPGVDEPEDYAQDEDLDYSFSGPVEEAIPPPPVVPPSGGTTAFGGGKRELHKLVEELEIFKRLACRKPGQTIIEVIREIECRQPVDRQESPQVVTKFITSPQVQRELETAAREVHALETRLVASEDEIAALLAEIELLKDNEAAILLLIGGLL